MGSRIIDLVALIMGGVMLADLVAHRDGTTALINGVQGLYSTSVNGLLGQPSR